MNKERKIFILSKKEFEVLVRLTEVSEAPSQRDLAEATGFSLGSVNKAMQALNQEGYIKDGMITSAGMSALEPYRVKRAVFVAAGFGSRMVPITLNTPKPLVRVHGVRMIETLLDAVLAAGIEDITIVRGYLAEQFDQLLYKYPMIKFVENPLYNEANNISSALCVRYQLSNAYVLEADLVASNPAIIKKYHYTSEFMGIPMERSDDWCFELKDGFIHEQKVGGLNCHQEVGISYWSEADGKKLAGHIQQAYDMPGGHELYWEQVPLKIFKKEYKVGICECTQEDIVEIDSFRELKAIDKTYDV